MSLQEQEFDVIVLGTGLVESVLAGFLPTLRFFWEVFLSLKICLTLRAFARIGKSVLHLDHSCQYGGYWRTNSLSEAVECCGLDDAAASTSASTSTSSSYSNVVPREQEWQGVDTLIRNASIQAGSDADAAEELKKV